MTTRTMVSGIAVIAALAVAALFFIFMNSSGLLFNFTSLQSTITVEDRTVGEGPGARPGDTVTIHYTGRLQDGTVFDSSVGRGPFTFILGVGMVIPGFDQGLMGMQVGGKRFLTIPPGLGYGAEGFGPVPGNTTLMFEVELLEIQPAGTAAPLPEGPEAN